MVDYLNAGLRDNSNVGKDSQKLRSDLDRTGIEEVVSRDGFVGRFVEDDVPRHQDIYLARGKHSHSGVCLSLPWLRALRLLRGHFEPCSEGTRDGSDGLQLRVHFGREQSANGGRIPTDEPS